MYAIIETGGKQYRVSEGDVLKVDRLSNQKSVTFKNVVMIADGENISCGNPYLPSAKVSAEVLGTALDRKVLVFKLQARKNHRKLRGHRQQMTSVKIKKIETD